MNTLRSILAFFRSHLSVVLFIVLFIILRVPSLFEPHWYGDEGVYASIALALEHGKRLYLDIYDNRLPLIYYIYTLGDTHSRLLFVRFLSMFAGVLTLIGIYSVGRRLKFGHAIIATLLVATWFLGTPLFEGNIANTENFFVPLTVWGIWFALSENKKGDILAGMLFGLAFLIKFQPFFTFAGLTIYLMIVGLKNWRETAFRCVRLVFGFSLPIVFVFILLMMNGSWKEAIQYGLLNNTSYVAEYSKTGITILWKTAGALICLSLLIYLYLKRRLSKTAALLLLLFLFDFYAVLFSGRKYEHYLLQLVPQLALLTGYLFKFLTGDAKIMTKTFLTVGFIGAILICRLLFYSGTGVAVRMHVPNYYREFIVSSLNMHYEPTLPFTFYREPSHLKVTEFIIERYKTTKIFFYTDDSWVYDYAHIVPPTFFVAMYHQTFIPNGTKRLITDLSKNPQDIIAVDKKYQPNTQVEQYLRSSYTKDFEDSYYQYFMLKKSISQY